MEDDVEIRKPFLEFAGRTGSCNADTFLQTQKEGDKPSPHQKSGSH